MSALKITWIGLGHMGTPMAINLLKDGFDVAVFNRSEQKMQSFIDNGVRFFTSIEDVVPNSDVVFTMLSDDNAVDSVYTELMNADISGTLFINMSTISPDLTIRLADEIKAKGGSYLDAPVSGSIKPATDGTLLILVGGENEDYDRSTQFFERLGKISLHLGAAGTGTKAKLAINYYMSVLIEGLAETVLFGEKNGIDKETMMFIVNESACGSGMSRMKTPFVVQNNYPAAFPLKYMDKDVKLAIKEGLNTETSLAMSNIYGEGMSQGLADEDLMAVIKTLKSKYF